MYIRNWTRKTSKGFYRATEALVWIGCVVLAGIVLLVFAGVFARYLLRSPVEGSYELVERTMAVVGGSAIMYAAVRRGHVAMDVLIARFSRRTQMIMQSIFSFLGFATWLVLAYRVYRDTLLPALKFSLTTDALHINTAPFLLILAVALFLCSLTLLIQTFHPVVSEETMGEKEEGVNEP